MLSRLRSSPRTLPTRLLRAFSTTPPTLLKKTPLYDLHLAHGANMVEFAGYSMPVLYAAQTHVESHKWVRAQAGVFDVSHMVQHVFKGPEATSFLEKITPSSLRELPRFQSTLSTLLLDTGGIADDLMITKRAEDEYYVVTNAGCRESDLAFFKRELQLFPSVEHVVLDESAILAVQGPRAAEVLQRLTQDDLGALKFGMAGLLDFKGSERYHVGRGGYTGEDGFEVSLPSREALSFTERMLASSEGVLKMIGLAARDSLRLEAGMCLYGHDLDAETTPVEGSLAWTIGKRRRAEGGFNGFETVARQLAEGVDRRRVGMRVRGPPAREGCVVYDESGTEVVGKITSGSPSPTAGGNVAMGYLRKGYWKTGTKVLVDVRGRKREGEVARMPFVETKYVR
ncbi:aminomethyltransferase [Myxozyma melibiosi]|uniref:Aminomethyltransferase n=1 Tax=Myxozyma melibiosi TaxID=54550 RepID=A0ABR1F2Q3_9ASCO